MYKTYNDDNVDNKTVLIISATKIMISEMKIYNESNYNIMFINYIILYSI